MHVISYMRKFNFLFDSTAFQSVTLIYVMRFFRTRCHLWQTSEIIGVSL